MVRSPYF
jgi:hypothetical protein